MAEQSEIDDFLAHVGVKGMKWGVRRDKTSGVRPIATTLNNSKFGKAANANAERHMAKQTHKAAVKVARKDVLTESLRKQSLGKHAVGTILTGTWYSSARVMEGAGYSRGKSVAMTFLGGPFATAIAINSKAKQRVAAAGA